MSYPTNSWLPLDLIRQVRGLLRVRFGGNGNKRGWGRGALFAGFNQTGGTLALGTVVRYTGGGNMVEATTADTDQAMGVVVGYFDSGDILVEDDAPDAGSVAVLTSGVTSVTLANDVARGDDATTSNTTGAASNSGVAFGKYLGPGTSGDAADVLILASGSGGGASIGTPALTLSTTNSAGAGPDVIATDATIAAFDATVPVTQAFGDSAATGSAGKAARRDHKHGMPASPSVPSGGTPALTLSTTNAAGAAATYVKTDATIAAFDATVPTTSAPGDAAAAGSAGVAARRDHVHGREATATGALEAALSNENSPVTTASGVTFRMPFAFTVTGVRASLKTAQASGSIFTVDIKKNGTTILSTLITIDNTEKTSTTAATPPVISVSSIADDDEILMTVTQIGDGTAVGCKATLIGHQ